MQKKVFNIIELFSGIGSQAKALKNIGADIEIVNTCEWNLHAFLAYSLIHDMPGNPDDITISKKEIISELMELGISNDGKEPINEVGLLSINEDALRKIYASITSTNNLVDISKVNGAELAGIIDIMTYSFPCQDLSNVGAFHGYKDGIDRDAGSRSGLLWEVERILIERKKADMYLPHFLLMENVPALNNRRHRKNFLEWQKQLNNLGYYNKQYLLNAKDFGLPQNRERLLMLSIFTDGDQDMEKAIELYFGSHEINPEDYKKATNKENTKLKNFLRTDYQKKKYYQEALACQPNATISRMKIWNENIQLTDTDGRVKDVITATLTTKQDRHPNSGNLWIDFKNGKANFRYLTPRECFLLMGFSETDYEKVLSGNFELKKNNKVFTRDNLIKMAGNSIAVNVLEALFMQILELDEKLFI